MHPSIRLAQATDADALAQLIADSAFASLSPHYSEEQMAAFLDYYSAASMRSKIAEQDVFCATMDGQLVGTIALTPDGFVVGFYTHADHFGKGVGKAMMQFMEQFAKQKGFDEIRLTASPVGLGFYQKHGWQRVSDYVFRHLGVGFDETLMLKQLT